MASAPETATASAPMRTATAAASSIDPNTGTRIYLGADEEDVTFRVNARFDLDLREGLRQYILMFEPAKPLCRADCAGLCPICGTDMNVGPHECKSVTDERWNALAGLKNEILEGN